MHPDQQQRTQHQPDTDTPDQPGRRPGRGEPGHPLVGAPTDKKISGGTLARFEYQISIAPFPPLQQTRFDLDVLLRAESHAGIGGHDTHIVKQARQPFPGMTGGNHGAIGTRVSRRTNTCIRQWYGNRSGFRVRLRPECVEQGRRHLTIEPAGSLKLPEGAQDASVVNDEHPEALLRYQQQAGIESGGLAVLVKHAHPGMD